MYPIRHAYIMQSSNVTAY